MMYALFAPLESLERSPVALRIEHATTRLRSPKGKVFRTPSRLIALSMRSEGFSSRERSTRAHARIDRFANRWRPRGRIVRLKQRSDNRGIARREYGFEIDCGGGSALDADVNWPPLDPTRPMFATRNVAPATP